MKRPFASPNTPHLDVELLSAYLDRQTTVAERARVESHLQTCAACRAELESLRRTVAVLAAMPRVPVPRAFTLSEAQVGLRRQAARPSWYGGLLRGLGAVTALALVVVVTATLVSRPGWTPGAMTARQAPEQAPTQMVAMEAPAPAPAATQAEPAAEAAPAAVAAAVEEPAVAALEAPAEVETESAGAGAAVLQAPAPAQADAPAAALVQESAPADAVAPTTEPTEDVPTAEAPAAMAAAAAEGPLSGTPTGTPADAAAPDASRMAVAPTTAPEQPAAKAGPVGAAESQAPLGMGGGGFGGGAADVPVVPGAVLTPAPLPETAAVRDVLPAGARVAYTDFASVWAIDRAGGARKLLDAKMAVTPVISSDGAWIAYKDVSEGYAELWVVRWDGSEPRRLLDERTLPQENLGASYSARMLQSYRWIPRQAALAVNLVAVPVAGALPRIELWRLDVATGDLTYVTDMGRAYAPLYSPDGTRFALLQYGTEAQPQGTLTLFSADGRERRVALTFPASPAKPQYDSQVQWMSNSRSLWVAIPTVDPTGPTPVSAMNGATLYRVPVNGEAVVAGEVDAIQVYWSADGSRLAYTRAVGDTGEVYELYLAGPDGAAAQLYGTLMNGMFLSWSPDSLSFLYQDGYQVYVGNASRKPQFLGNMVSVVDPRWVSNRQIISRHDTGSGWLLTLRGVDGSAYGLLPLPREAELDVARR